MQQQQISVITLGVDNLARSKRFYVEGFGWKPVFENEEIVFYQMNGLMLGTWLAPKLDAVVLVTGDGDFVPLVEYLQMNQGCQVEVVSFGKSTSAKLIEAADDFIDLDQNPQKYLIDNKGNFRARGKGNQKPKEETENALKQ